MSNLVATEPREFTQQEMALIRDTVAKNATNDEFRLFLYRCKHMGLDPLKPGQIHFVKYNANSPGTIIVGIEGFRVRAAKTGKHSGTKRGVIRDESGKCIGAWCEVYRSDWSQPAREEVSLNEYFKAGQNGKPSQWDKMPETMIKKVAECAALRMAFPDELGGVYGKEEMDQAESPAIDVVPNQLSPADEGIAAARADARSQSEQHQEPSSREVADDLANYKVPLSFVNGGSRLSELGLSEIEASIDYWIKRGRTSPNGRLTGAPAEFVDKATRYVARERARKNSPDWQDEDFDTAFDAAKAAK
jgi:phage recombination protein Bet